MVQRGCRWDPRDDLNATHYMGEAEIILEADEVGSCGQSQMKQRGSVGLGAQEGERPDSGGRRISYENFIEEVGHDDATIRWVCLIKMYFSERCIIEGGKCGYAAVDDKIIRRDQVLRFFKREPGLEGAVGVKTANDVQMNASSTTY